jgi:hypothetical protein
MLSSLQLCRNAEIYKHSNLYQTRIALRADYQRPILLWSHFSKYLHLSTQDQESTSWAAPSITSLILKIPKTNPRNSKTHLLKLLSSTNLLMSTDISLSRVYQSPTLIFFRELNPKEGTVWDNRRQNSIARPCALRTKTHNLITAVIVGLLHLSSSDYRCFVVCLHNPLSCSFYTFPPKSLAW